jgi:hypothetical protein
MNFLAKTIQKPRSHFLRRGLRIFKPYLFSRELGKNHLICASIRLSNILIITNNTEKRQDLLWLFQAEPLSEKNLH